MNPEKEKQKVTRKGNGRHNWFFLNLNQSLRMKKIVFTLVYISALVWSSCGSSKSEEKATEEQSSEVVDSAAVMPEPAAASAEESVPVEDTSASEDVTVKEEGVRKK